MDMEMPKILNNFAAANGVKKALDEKYRERLKIYGYVGMEVYDLYKQNKISIPEVEMHLEKLKEMDKEIADLEAEKQRMEAESGKPNVCSCGCTLTGKERFCPKCGKPVENGAIVCTCGRTVDRGMMFCPSCGKSVKELQEKLSAGAGAGFEGAAPAGGESVQKYRECTCGAKVPEGQRMCMECGRMMEE